MGEGEKPRKTKKQRRERRAAIIHELARLSRNGWRDARPDDYQPLERELRTMEA